MKLLPKLIACLICSQVFAYQFMDPSPMVQVGVTFSPDRVLYCLVCIALLILLFGDNVHLPLQRTEVYMLIFTLFCTASWYLSGADWEADLSSQGYRYLTTLFNFIFIPYVVYLSLKSLPYSKETSQMFVRALFLLGIYLVLVGFFEHYRISALVWPSYILDPSVGIQFGRARGPFASSSAYGGALIVIFLVAMLLITRAEGTRRRWLSLFLALNLAVIYFTYQRSVWLTLALSLAILYFASTRMKKPAKWIAVLVACVFVLGVGSKFSLSQGTLFSRRQQTIDYRLTNYITTIEMFKQNPILGIGYGRFHSDWSKYFRTPQNSEIEALTDGNHNTFLGVAAELGAVGLVLYLLILYRMLKSGWKVYRETRRLGWMWEQDLAVLSLAITLGFILQAQFSDYRYTQFLNTVMFAFLGIICAIERSLPQGEAEQPGHLRSAPSRAGLVRARHTALSSRPRPRLRPRNAAKAKASRVPGRPILPTS